MYIRDGKMIPTAEPMVEPTIPRTNSMSGIMMPRKRVMAITLTVMTLNRVGGI